MLRTRIKFCGLTRPDDVQAAVTMGADLLGFVFVPRSARRVDPVWAETQRQMLPPGVSTVALFQDAAPADIEAVLRAFQPDWLQFHGSEHADECRRWGRRYLKAVAMKGGADPLQVREAHPEAAALLLDGHAPGALGGSGETFDWSRAQAKIDCPLFVAGGLGPENVARAIEVARPWGVDVSSGIESAPGLKDSGRMRDFVLAVRAADAAP